MNSTLRRREAGQTIVVALVVLGLLLILGFVFLGLISRNITRTSQFRSRTIANEAAEAGIRYADEQLQRSPLGADWRGDITPPIADLVNPVLSRDPDAAFLRAASPFAIPGGGPDRGGPDGLGAFVRIPATGGRTLIRVSYAPSDANIFADNPVGPLRNPGVVRNYLMVESIGREGVIDPRDPTTLTNGQPVQIAGYGSQAQFEASLAALRAQLDLPNARVLTAFKSIGLTDTTRFITNKNNETRAAEIGVPPDLGAQYQAVPGGAITPVSSLVPYQLGVPNMENAAGSPITNIGGSGSLHSNADLAVYGQVNVFANASLGDQITVAGAITNADSGVLNILRRDFTRNPFTWLPATNITLAGGQLDSRSNLFNTAGGLVRDGSPTLSADGRVRGASYKASPDVFSREGVQRYMDLTRESGETAAGSNTGRYGYGQGIYVDNAGDLQTPSTEASRMVNPGSRSLVYEWLNPNATDTRNWFGPFYVPTGAYVEFDREGFTITRDIRGPINERFWRNPAGVSTNSSSIRYRIGRGPFNVDHRMRIVNTFTPGLPPIDGPLNEPDFLRGALFNGVLYFDGNVRVRGVIPTDVQLTLVSGGTIYVEGSLTKGNQGNFFTATYAPPLDPENSTAQGAPLGRASRSTLGLIARDYVAINTTMFLGPSVNSLLGAGPDANSVRVRQDENLSLKAEITEAPVNPINPYNLVPQPSLYRDAVSNALLPTQLLVTHAMGNEAADRTFMSLAINRGWFDNPVVTSTYFFPNVATNAASPEFQNAPIPATIPIYGLGIEPYQRFPQYESTAFDLIDPTSATLGAGTITATANTGSYTLFVGRSNEFRFLPVALNQPSNDYLLARAAIAPHDIKIEAMIFAENGSFFVIPGPWFNPNANDRRDAYLARVQVLVNQGNTEPVARAIADDERLRNFGYGASVPFYGEPLDEKITIYGSVTENMPPPMSEQAEWLRKWGWIPAKQGATLRNIPRGHLNAGQDLNATPVAPNIVFAYDPILGSGRTTGFAGMGNDVTIVRTDSSGRILPPIPRLPVSPGIAYFGELN